MRLEVERWLDELGDQLLGYALARVADRDAAEELLQETFLSALKGFHQFDQRSQPITWLTAILRHKIHDYYRSRQRQQRGLHEMVRRGRGESQGLVDDAGHIEDQASTPGGTHERRLPTNPARWAANPQKSLEMAEFWEVFDGCLDEMPAHFRETFQLRDIDELPSDEVCKILGLTATNLSVRMHRARMLLRKCLEMRWFARGDEGAAP
jgi:RNA polymerase sigma-70 factor (ECF subfamily)